MGIPKAEIRPEPQAKQRGVVIVPMKSRGVVTQPEDRHRARQAERPFLLEHDILKVTNVDDVTWDFRWDRRHYIIKPQETGYVPFPALCMALGDPRSAIDIVTRFNTEDGQRGLIPTRHEVLCTLYARYGIQNEDAAEMVAFAPKMEVRTMDTDVQIHFPSEDPNMAPWPVPQAPQPGRENSDTRRLIDELRAENAAGREELAELRSLVRDRLSSQEPPVGIPDPAAGHAMPGGPAPAMQDEDDPLAQALAGGAPTDEGPAASFG